MAIKFKLKRGTSTPTTSDLDNGEVGVDTQAKIIYINDSGTVKALGSDLGNVGENIIPATDSTYNLGSTTKRFGYGYFDYLNLLHTATINSTLTVEGTAYLKGEVNLGNTDADDVLFYGSLASDILPKTDNARKLGTSQYRFSQVYATSFHGDGSNLTGVAPTGSITPSASLTFDIGTSSLKYAHIFTDKISNNRIQGYNSQNIYFNNSISSQDIRIKPGSAGNTRIESHVLPYADYNYNLGSASDRWYSLYVRDIYLDQRLRTTNSVTAGQLTITGGQNSTKLEFESSAQNTLGALYFAATHTFGVMKVSGAYRFKIEDSGQVNVYGDMLPDSNNVSKLGLSGNKWEEVHATTYYGDGSNLTNVAFGLALDNQTIKAVGTTNLRLFNSASVGIKIDNATDAILPSHGSAINIGASNDRFKQVHATQFYGDGSFLTGVAKTDANTFTANQTISKADPKLILNDTNTGGTSYSIFSDGGQFRIYNESSGGGVRFTVTSNGSVFTSNNLSVSGNISVSGTVDGVDIAALNTTVSNITPGIASLVADTSPQLGGNLDVNGKVIEFGDSSGATDDRLKIGSHDDLQLYHDGTDSYIESTQGELVIKHTGNGVIKFERQSSNGIKIDGGANLIPFIDDSANCGTSSKRWQTVYGVAGNFSGTVTANAFSGDGSNLTGIASSITSDAEYNTVGGTNAGNSHQSVTTALFNTYFGYDAGEGGQNAYSCTFVGYKAGRGNRYGRYNTGIGEDSLTNLSSFSAGRADGNSALGTGAGRGVTTGEYNTAVGTFSLQASNPGVSSDFNTAIGAYAGYTLNTGTENVFVGKDSGKVVTTGSNNTIIGAGAANTGTYDLTTGSNNILLGHDAAASSSTVSNEVTIGDANITKFRIPGTNFELDSGIVSVKNSGTRSEVRWYCETNNAHYAAIKAPAHSDFSGNLTFVLPPNYGSNGQVLQSDGSGGTSWTTPSSGGASVGGSNTQVQFNSSGALAGSNNLTFDGTNLAVGGTVSAASSASGTPGLRKITASTSTPSGGSDGDVWIKYT